MLVYIEDSESPDGNLLFDLEKYLYETIKFIKSTKVLYLQ